MKSNCQGNISGALGKAGAGEQPRRTSTHPFTRHVSVDREAEPSLIAVSLTDWPAGYVLNCVHKPTGNVFAFTNFRLCLISQILHVYFLFPKPLKVCVEWYVPLPNGDPIGRCVFACCVVSTFTSLPFVWLLFQLQADKWVCLAICGYFLPNMPSEVRTSAAVVWDLHVASSELPGLV